MPLSGDKIFNVINFSIASASLVSLLIGSISPSTLPDFQSAFALSSLYFGSDGLYRLYKGKKENHETPRSGIIGGLYERIVQGKKFF